MDAVSLCEVAGERRDGLLASLELAYIRGMGGDLRTLESGARSVLEAAEAAGDRSVMLYAFGVAGLGALCQGHFAQAAADLERSATMAREDGNRYRLNWSLAALGWMYGLQGQVEPALQSIAEMKRKNPSWRESIAPEVEAHVHWLSGELPRLGRVHVRRARNESGDAGLPPGRGRGVRRHVGRRARPPGPGP